VQAKSLGICRLLNRFAVRNIVSDMFDVLVVCSSSVYNAVGLLNCDVKDILYTQTCKKISGQ